MPSRSRSRSKSKSPKKAIPDCGPNAPMRRKAIGVMTSGGDASGMNAAVQAVVEHGFRLGFRVYFIHHGYQGMYTDEITEACAYEVKDWHQKGGTFIKTARLPQFRTDRSIRLKCAENLIKKGICNLVVIGGDGSLAGANLLHLEWTSYLEELFNKKIITDVQLWNNRNLMVVGIVSSIDNDFPCTDMTLGADSAMTRIYYCIAALRDTAMSHDRTMVVEVMGRNCGYLAARNGLKFRADYVFIPECPPEVGWEARMVDHLRKTRAEKGYNLVILSESARDRNGRRITAEGVAQFIKDTLGHDVRTCKLGHVQRGGAPTEFDQNLGKEFGKMAIDTFLEARVRRPGKFVLCLKGNEVASHQLDVCVAQVDAIAADLQALRYDDALAKRGKKFNQYVRALKKRIPLMIPPNIVVEATE